MALTHPADSARTVFPAADAGAPAKPGVLDAGDKVEVRRRLDDKWARGFAVLTVTEGGYRLRRLSDGVELPTTFAPADVRKERKRSTWWY